MVPSAPAMKQSMTNTAPVISKPPTYPDKNLLDDDNDLLNSFSITDKIGKEDNLMANSSELNFLNEIPDPTDELLDPALVGDTDAAYDLISHVLENGMEKLDLSNRKLGDEFFKSLIDSIVEFADGDPLALTEINFSNNEIGDEGCQTICEFLITEKDTAAKNLASVNLSRNKIKDRSVDILMVLCSENSQLSTLDLRGNEFKSKLAMNKLRAVEGKQVLL